MGKLSDRLHLAKIVLHELKKIPLGRTQLEKKTVKKTGTHATFESIFAYLIHTGRIEKTGEKYRAPYAITEKGLKLLEALENE